MNMSTEYFASNVVRTWKKLIKNAKNEVWIFSPYLSSSTAETITLSSDCSKIKIFTKFSLYDFITGASSLKTLKKLHLNGIEIFQIDNLHAKLIIIDDEIISIGSQNVTLGGTKNKEVTIITKNDTDLYKLIDKVEDWVNESTEINIKMIEYAELIVRKEKKDIDIVLNQIRMLDKNFERKYVQNSIKSEIPNIREKIQQLRDTKNALNLTEQQAKKLIADSAWWLKHRYGPCRSPRDAEIVKWKYGRWQIHICGGANGINISGAVNRILSFVTNLLLEIEEDTLIDLNTLTQNMKRAITYSVINSNDDEYYLYDSLEGQDVLFGSHSIDYIDFNRSLFEIIGFLDSYEILTKEK